MSALKFINEANLQVLLLPNVYWIPSVNSRTKQAARVIITRRGGNPHLRERIGLVSSWCPLTISFSSDIVRLVSEPQDLSILYSNNECLLSVLHHRTRPYIWWTRAELVSCHKTTASLHVTIPISGQLPLLWTAVIRQSCFQFDEAIYSIIQSFEFKETVLWLSVPVKQPT